MAGLTHIQTTTTLKFDDGIVVTFATTPIHKDIRHGDYFSDDQTKDMLFHITEELTTLIGEKTLTGLHDTAMKCADPPSPNNDITKPRYGDSFSDN